MVSKGELAYGLKKLRNPRQKLIKGAGLLSMKTIDDYNHSFIYNNGQEINKNLSVSNKNIINNNSRFTYKKKVSDIIVNNDNNKESNKDTLTLSNSSFFKNHLDLNNTFNNINYINLNNKSKKENEKIFDSMSSINVSQNEKNHSQSSNFLIGTGKNILSRINEEYIKIIEKEKKY